MMNKILIIYKSKTGFTKRYAEQIAKETNAELMEFKNMTVNTMSEYETVIYGGRLHIGTIDGLKKVKEYFSKSGAKNFVIFTTGAMPDSEKEIISEMWKNNLTPDEIVDIPYFYMPSGLCYEKMSVLDKVLMKGLKTMMKKKKDKTPKDISFEKAIANSYDISSKDYIIPLVSCLKR